MGRKKLSYKIFGKKGVRTINRGMSKIAPTMGTVLGQAGGAALGQMYGGSVGRQLGGQAGRMAGRELGNYVGRKFHRRR